MNSTEYPLQEFSQLRQQAEEALKKISRRKKSASSTKYSIVDTLKLLNELQVHQIELELQNQELQESRIRVEMGLAHYTDLYDFALAGYFTFDREGIITQINLMAATFLAVERCELLGKPFVNFITKNQHFIFKALLDRVFATRVRQNCELTIVRNDHSSMILQIEAKLYNNGQDCQAVVQDITEQRRRENLARLHQVELTQIARVNSMGELASAIAHEINQPLTVILNYVNGCVRRLEDNNYKIEEILDVLRIVAKQVELAGKIMHHMKNIVRQDETYYKSVFINDIAEAATSQIQKEMQYYLSAPLELDLSDNLPLVNADHIQIELVILNLLRNSFESVCNANVENPKIILRTCRQDDMIVVSVTDNGPHYSTEVESHLFEPCFTTKKAGAGMGLSISRTIIEAHSGHLSSKRLPVVGVCFQFSLPAIMKEYEV
jgi:PAS domain S-box-containing protein